MFLPRGLRIYRENPEISEILPSFWKFIGNYPLATVYSLRRERPLHMDQPQVERADDPDRCQGVDRGGQCWNYRVEGYDYCPRHGGRPNVVKRKEVRTYQLDIIHEAPEYEACTGVDVARPLRVELAQLRVVLEKRLAAFAREDCWEGADAVNVIQNAIAKLHRTEKEIKRWLQGCWHIDQLIDMTHAMVDTAEQFVGEVLTDLRSDALSIIESIQQAPDTGTEVPDVLLQAMGMHQSDFLRFYSSNHHQSLIEEVALARFTVIRMFGACQTPGQLARYASAITRTIETVAGLVKEAIRIEIETRGWVNNVELRPYQEKLAKLIIPVLQRMDNYEEVSDQVVDQFNELDAQYQLTYED